MKKLIVVLFSTLLATSMLTGCTNRDMGTTAGATLGGVAGYALTGGNVVGAAAGAVGGGIVGNQLSK